MKRFVRLASLALCAILSLGVAVFAACSKDDAEPQKSCLVQVEGGTGGGYYYVDTNCTVIAEVPAGKQFIKWVSGETDLSPNAEYTFTVTKNIKLKAIFADDVATTEAVTLNVKYGFGSGRYLKGTTVRISVENTAYYGAVFADWSVTYKGADGKTVTEIISNETEFDLLADKDMAVEARYMPAKLQKPVNENGEMFKIAANGAYELDRNTNAEFGKVNPDNGKVTALVDGCAYLLYNAYELKAGTDDEYVLVGQAKLVLLKTPVQVGADTIRHYWWNMEGTEYALLKGKSGDIYQDDATQKTKIRDILNVESGKTYYISVQTKGGDGETPLDSEESAKFAVAF